MGKRDDPELLRLDLIDDTVGEAAKGKPTRRPTPQWAKSGVGGKEADGAFELGDKRESEFGAGLLA